MTEQDRIEYFKNEISRLSNQVVDLLDERDQFKAQVEQLRAAYITLSGKITDIDDTETDSEEIADALWRDLFQSLRERYEICQKTPAQCLAEIKAQAGRDGYIEGANDWCAPEYTNCNDILNSAERHAELIRQADKGK